MAKVFEKLVHMRLMDFLDKEEILSKQQFGFREGFNTSQAILDVTEKYYKVIEQKKWHAVYSLISRKRLIPLIMTSFMPRYRPAVSGVLPMTFSDLT